MGRSQGAWRKDLSFLSLRNQLIKEKEELEKGIGERTRGARTVSRIKGLARSGMSAPEKETLQRMPMNYYTDVPSYVKKGHTIRSKMEDNYKPYSNSLAPLKCYEAHAARMCGSALDSRKKLESKIGNYRSSVSVQGRCITNNSISSNRLLEIQIRKNVISTMTVEEKADGGAEEARRAEEDYFWP